jgi:CheY-like chemotaxis protein
MLRATLEHSGHTVIEARDGAEGLVRFQHANADLVITDLVMPGTEGFEVLRALRSTYPLVKIIAISGAGPAGGATYVEAARLPGAAKVLAKPFSACELMAAIDDLLPGGAADQLAQGP